MGAAQKEAAQRIHDFVQNTQSGALGVIGMLLLVYVAIQMLASIEATFNDIWGVTRAQLAFAHRPLLDDHHARPAAAAAALGLAGGSQLQAPKIYRADAVHRRFDF